MDNAIQTAGLSKKYGNKWAIRGVEIEVPRKSVYGFLGPNGAGKTTTIRCLMNFIKPTKGIISVLGMDSQDDAKMVHKRIGYLTGEMDYYENLTGRQYISYMGHLQGNHDKKEINKLAKRLKADLGVKIKTLSRGNKQKIGLISAFQHKPELLVLDEPTSGLDPILQREFVDMVFEHKAAGGTTFISSHFLMEVEQMCDMVCFINKGRVVEEMTLEKLHERSVHEFDVVFKDKKASKDMLDGVKGVKELKVSDNFMHCHIAGSVDGFLKAIAKQPVRSLRTRELDLEEIFLKMYGRDVPNV
jgi:ABC-2 type transport system ATP-binding protein